MAISTPAVGAATTATATTTTSRMDVGKDEFLSMLVAQLRHQDPMNPMNSQEFAAQLAQFSSLEQLTQLNDVMAASLQMSQVNALIGQTQFGASLMGKTVVAAGNRLHVPTTGASSIHVDVGGKGGRATLTLLDDKGATVATRDLGTVAGGLQTLALPSDLPAGDYTYRLEVTGADDATVAVTTYTTGVVDGVVFRDGAIYLRLGTLEVALDDVASLEPAPAAGTANAVAPSVPGGALRALAGAARTFALPGL